MTPTSTGWDTAGACAQQFSVHLKVHQHHLDFVGVYDFVSSIDYCDAAWGNEVGVIVNQLRCHAWRTPSTIMYAPGVTFHVVHARVPIVCTKTCTRALNSWCFGCSGSCVKVVGLSDALQQLSLAFISCPALLDYYYFSIHPFLGLSLSVCSASSASQ